MIKMNRRFFLQSAVLTGATVAGSKAFANPLLQGFKDSSPIPLINDPISSSATPFSKDFNGDDITRPHDVLWDLPGYLKSKGGEPAVEETREWIVVGGGASGLVSAYYLKDKNPLLLEQAPQFGGNSKGEKFGNSTYSMGAAYVCVPDEGSKTEKFFKELGLLDKAKSEEDTKVFFNNQVQNSFWEGSTDPVKADSVKEFHEIMKNIFDNEFPEIPHVEDSPLTKDQLDELDKISFAQWLEQKIPNLSEHAKEYCQLYAWSSFVASIDEISAAQMLNFIAAEIGGIMTWPGGNSIITQSLYNHLKNENGVDSLRAGCIVLQVKCVKDGVEVLYEDEKRKVRKAFAKKCVVATPKFVAKYILPDLPALQKKAFDQIDYRGYVVANVILKKQIQSPSFELYCLEGKLPETPGALAPPKRGFTDICFGSWAQDDLTENSVLTIYKALPMDGARQFLFSPFAHDKNKKAVEDSLTPVLQSLGISSEDILGIRLTRWGHSMPVAKTGFIANGMPELLSEPIQEKIYFINQDNWANPCFECAHTQALGLIDLK